jgi:hypothetical protein
LVPKSAIWLADLETSPPYVLTINQNSSAVGSIGNDSFVINKSNAKGRGGTFKLDASRKGKLVGDVVKMTVRISGASAAT